jgi:hypothetical protein
MPVQSKRSGVFLPLSILVLSTGTYIGAFAAPYEEYPSGLAVFTLGLLLCWVPAGLPWWANVLYWVALGYSCQGKWAPAAKYGLFSVCLAAAWLLVDDQASRVPAFQLWIGSMAALALGALIMRALARERELGAPSPRSIALPNGSG